MRVLSLFDGISCARVALDRASIPVDEYLSSEIDPAAIKISSKAYPDIVRLGDVRSITEPLGQIEILIGGSPCQDLSIAKQNRQGLAGHRSNLFWEYVRIKELVKPRWFILENVASMPKADRDTITEALGVEPVLLDAALVSAQSRKRLFWTNLPVHPLTDRGILLKDILESDGEVDPSFTLQGKSFCLTSTYHKVGTADNEIEHNRKRKQRTMVFSKTHRIRKLTPVECERLQGLPDGYTEGVAKTQRYKLLGNAFNVDVIAHLIRGSRTTSASSRP